MISKLSEIRRHTLIYKFSPYHLIQWSKEDIWFSIVRFSFNLIAKNSWDNVPYGYRWVARLFPPLKYRFDFNCFPQVEINLALEFKLTLQLWLLITITYQFQYETITYFGLPYLCMVLPFFLQVKVSCHFISILSE